MDFGTFDTWNDAVKFARERNGIWYQAPMDYRPRWCGLEFIRGNNLRLNPMNASADPFWANAGHLDCMRKPLTEEYGRWWING